MRKKVLSGLVLAGVMAAAMIPVSVSAVDTTTTTVGYTTGGNVSPDGHIMVTVPKDVSFTQEGTAVENFDVEAKVWDSTTAQWVTPSADNQLGTGKTIDVSVTSANGFLLRRNTGDQNGQGEYQYTVTGLDTPAGGVLDKGVSTKKTKIGTLKDGTGAENTDAKYKIAGTVKMTKTPKSAQTEKAVLFYDTLTYEFTGLNG